MSPPPPHPEPLDSFTTTDGLGLDRRDGVGTPQDSQLSPPPAPPSQPSPLSPSAPSSPQHDDEPKMPRSYPEPPPALRSPKEGGVSSSPSAEVVIENPPPVPSSLRERRPISPPGITATSAAGAYSHHWHEYDGDESIWTRLRDDFTQQQLYAWRPIFFPRCVLVTFFTMAVAFLLIGSLLYRDSANAGICSVRYDNKGPVSINNEGAPLSVQMTAEDCQGNVNDQYLSAPVFVQYEVARFYHAHRLFFESRSVSQLRGVNELDEAVLSPCTPWLKVHGAENPKHEGKIRVPCGQFPRSVFNDTFEILSQSSLTPYKMDQSAKRISWDTDISSKFFNPPPLDATVHWMKEYVKTSEGEFNPYADRAQTKLLFPEAIESPHFINWMRTQGLPRFKKLWAVIDEDVKWPVNIIIHNRWPVTDFEGAKYIVLSTASWFGGEHFFLAFAFLLSGCLFGVFGIFFLVRHLTDQREIADTKIFLMLVNPDASQKSQTSENRLSQRGEGARKKTGGATVRRRKKPSEEEKQFDM